MISRATQKVKPTDISFINCIFHLLGDDVAAKGEA